MMRFHFFLFWIAYNLVIVSTCVSIQFLFSVAEYAFVASIFKLISLLQIVVFISGLLSLVFISPIETELEKFANIKLIITILVWGASPVFLYFAWQFSWSVENMRWFAIALGFVMLIYPLVIFLLPRSKFSNWTKSGHIFLSAPTLLVCGSMAFFYIISQNEMGFFEHSFDTVRSTFWFVLDFYMFGLLGEVFDALEYEFSDNSFSFQNSWVVTLFLRLSFIYCVLFSLHGNFAR